MTFSKPRRPGTWADAITTVIGALGADQAARVVGKTPSLVRKWSDPDSDHWPNLQQALALDMAYAEAGLGAGPILAVYTAQAAEEQNTHSVMRPSLRLALLTQKVGTLAGEIGTQAMRGDHRFTLGDGCLVLREIDELRKLLGLLEKDITTVMPQARERLALMEALGGDICFYLHIITPETPVD